MSCCVASTGDTGFTLNGEDPTTALYAVECGRLPTSRRRRWSGKAVTTVGCIEALSREALVLRDRESFGKYTHTCQSRQASKNAHMGAVAASASTVMATVMLAIAGLTVVVGVGKFITGIVLLPFGA